MPYLNVNVRDRLASVDIDDLGVDNKVNALLRITDISAIVFSGDV